MKSYLFGLVGLFLVCSRAPAAQPQWQPAKAPLMTRWAKEVSPANDLPEYPRPQMVRNEWVNLNGLWDFAVTAREAAQPETFNQQILVPFPAESALSGVMTNITEQQRLWYRRQFEAPAIWAEKRVLLHFGAVDFETT